MPLWDRVRTELDRAGRVAQSAVDEGRDRLEAMRARQLADRTAQALGYVVFRAHAEEREADRDTVARLAQTLAEHEAEVARLESRFKGTRG